MVPVNDLAAIAETFSRNEILTPNEFRAVLGYRPSSDPKANELNNSNMPEQKTIPPKVPLSIDTNNKEVIQNE